MRTKLRRQITVILGVSILLGVFNNCAEPKHDIAKNNPDFNFGSTAQSIEIFSTTLHPVLTQNCGSCHGSNQFPLFAVTDPTSSHQTLLGSRLVNLTSPSSSRLVTKIQNGHQGKPAALAVQIETEITSWADKLKALGGQAPALPVIEPLTATYTSISQNILLPKCASCHSAATPQAGKRYDTYAETIKTVNLANPAESKLYTTTFSGEMPPSPADSLTDEELAVILAWMNAGAPNN